MKRKHWAAFVDTVLAFLMVFLLLPHQPQTEAVTVNPGSVMVRIEWGEDIDADIDLWVQAPDDVPVGYSNLGGDIFNLLRDDLGFARDVSPRNEEYAFSRGAPAGEYTVNVHGYRLKDIPLVEVTVSATIMWPGRKPRLLFRKTVAVRQGEEVTVARFMMDASGRLRGLHDLPKKLRGR